MQLWMAVQPFFLFTCCIFKEIAVLRECFHKINICRQFSFHEIRLTWKKVWMPGVSKLIFIARDIWVDCSLFIIKIWILVKVPALGRNIYTLHEWSFIKNQIFKNAVSLSLFFYNSCFFPHTSVIVSLLLLWDQLLLECSTWWVSYVTHISKRQKSFFFFALKFLLLELLFQSNVFEST